MSQFLNGIIKEMDQSEPGSSWAPNGKFLNGILKEMDKSEPCRILEELVSLSLRAPELQMGQYLDEIVKEWTSLSLGAPELQKGSVS